MSDEHTIALLGRQLGEIAELRAEVERLNRLLTPQLPFLGKESMTLEECADNDLCTICGFTIVGQAADTTWDGERFTQMEHAACRELAAAEARYAAIVEACRERIPIIIRDEVWATFKIQNLHSFHRDQLTKSLQEKIAAALLPPTESPDAI